MSYLDLTRTLTNNLPVYPGDVSPTIVPVASLEEQGHADYRIVTTMHVGTHLDSPAHMLPGGKRLVDFPVDYFFGSGVLVDGRGQAIIGEEILTSVTVKPGSIVLILTGWSKEFGAERYYKEYPVLSEALAKRLVELKIKMVGLDSPSPDQPPFNAHKILLQNEILIMENLVGLEELEGKGEFEVMALPAKFDTEGAPVRVVAKIN